jgi:branched-chain amino acid transport system permease protein
LEEFFQHILNGLALGSIYALIALGYTMVYGILRLINFAHGDVYMIGAFSGYYIARTLGIDTSPSLLYASGVLLLSMMLCAALGFLIERIAYRPLRNAPRINALITAIGVSLFLEYTGQIIFGADPKFFPTIVERSVVAQVGQIELSNLQILVTFVAFGLMLALRFVVQSTKMGRAMRALSFDYSTARLIGIPANKIVSFTFMLGAGLAAAAGILVGTSYPRIEPLMGIMPGLKAFVAAVLGGIGSFPGAVVGGLIMGFSEEMVVGYFSSTYRDALAFAILIGILLFKPAGLFGKYTPEKV